MVPGERSKFDAPMFEAEIFRKKMYCNEKVLVTLLRLLAPHAVIWRPHSDSAPGELHPVAPPVDTPLATKNSVAGQMWPSGHLLPIPGLRAKSLFKISFSRFNDFTNSQCSDFKLLMRHLILTSKAVQLDTVGLKFNFVFHSLPRDEDSRSLTKSWEGVVAEWTWSEMLLDAWPPGVWDEPPCELPSVRWKSQN